MMMMMMTQLPMILSACSSSCNSSILILKFVRWNDEASITHDVLRMYDGVIVVDDAVRLDEGYLR
jgi:hypothetical protein